MSNFGQKLKILLPFILYVSLQLKNLQLPHAAWTTLISACGYIQWANQQGCIKLLLFLLGFFFISPTWRCIKCLLFLRGLLGAKHQRCIGLPLFLLGLLGDKHQRCIGPPLFLLGLLGGQAARVCRTHIVFFLDYYQGAKHQGCIVQRRLLKDGPDHPN